MFRLFLCLLRRKIRVFEVLSEQCSELYAEQRSELYRRVFGYCSDRKRAGDSLCILSGEMADTKFRQRTCFLCRFVLLCYNGVGDANG